MEIKAELLYPYTQDEKTKFIVEQNHRNGYEIREVRREKNTEISVPDYADVTEINQVEVPYIEMEQKEVEVEIPIFETNEETGEIVQVGTETTIETIEEPVEKIRIEEQEVVVKKQIGSYVKTKTEIVIDLQAWGYTEEEIEEQKKEQFLKDFFNTSLGWVRRKVSMQTGEIKDFLADILPILQVGIPILTYTEDGEQNKVLVTEEFIDECKQQVIKDFYGA